MNENDDQRGAVEVDGEDIGPRVESTEDVVEWLKRIGMEEYVDAFQKNEVNREVLCSLTAEEIRDDLGVVNLRHRRDLLKEIGKIAGVSTVKQALPEHGRILDHLSNVRTFHSWVRVGVQLLAFALIVLRLYPVWRSQKSLVTAFSLYFSLVGVFAILYGIGRYVLVIRWIEASGANTPKYIPDTFGVLSILSLVFIATVLTLLLIVWEGF